MELGPLQLMVVGFDRPDFQGEVAEEIVRLSDAGVVRLIDLIVVHKDREGNTTTVQTTELTPTEMQDFGISVGALVGLEVGGPEGAVAGAVAGAEATADGHLLDDLDLVDVLEEIEPDSAAAIALLEHQWAIPLREAILRNNGVPVLDMWVHPDELIAFGGAAGD